MDLETLMAKAQRVSTSQYEKKSSSFAGRVCRVNKFQPDEGFDFQNYEKRLK